MEFDVELPSLRDTQFRNIDSRYLAYLGRGLGDTLSRSFTANGQRHLGLFNGRSIRKVGEVNPKLAGFPDGQWLVFEEVLQTIGKFRARNRFGFFMGRGSRCRIRT